MQAGKEEVGTRWTRGGTVKRWLDQWVESSGGQKGY